MTSDASPAATRLTSEIAALQQAIAALAALPDAQQPLLVQLADKERQLAMFQSGGINFGVGAVIGQTADIIAGDKLSGDKVLRDKIVNNFFGGAPGERGETLLMDYLAALARDCDQLRLGRLRERRRSGAERGTAPEMRLQAVYTSLTTDGAPIEIYRRTRPLRQVQRLRDWLAQRACDADSSAPECVRLLALIPDAGTDFSSLADTEDHQSDPNKPVMYRIIRPELAIEAIRVERRLVLLGEPGYGKSTVLRYLALLLARWLRGEDVVVPGWPDDDLPIPILCPLGNVAAALEAHGGDADQALWHVLGDVLDGEQGVSAGLRNFLTPALRAGGALLLLDGLDEVLVGAGNDGPRRCVALAVQRLAQRVRARIVVTSRVLPYRAAPDWQFSVDEGWSERIIQPLAFGQVRTFVQGWYRALTPSDPDLTAQRAEGRADELIEELDANDRLRPLVQSPLLLTMLALLHYNSNGDIPRDRARLYHECVQLLLERWEPVRTPGVRDRASRLQQLLARLPGLETDKLRDVLHELAFTAHDAPPGDDGRGQVDRYRLTGRLVEFFKLLRSSDPTANADTFLGVVREEAGLLLARDDERAYAFPHLTFQEYLAACWLADQRDMNEQAYARWCAADRERWRQVLLLLAGRLRQKGQKDVERDGVPWLELLAGATVHGTAKDATQRRRDAVLAALSYAEMGGRAALSTSMRDLVAQVERPLRDAITALLMKADSAIPSVDRVAAAQVLGALGDPRPGVCTLAPEWCDVPAGPFLLGTTDTSGEGRYSSTPQRLVELPAFRIARYPVTNAQWRAFLDAGGYREQRWWSAAGRQVKEHAGWIQPAEWDNPRFNGTNQPVVGISWYEASAFCRWLSAELGYAVRLPSEAEWEKAARGADGRNYPWGDEWDAVKTNTRESGIDATTPVGCFADGASPYGALDMSGNVFEWTATPWTDSYDQSDGTARETEDGPLFVWRGGAWTMLRGYARCAYRDYRTSAFRTFVVGLRVVAALTPDE